MIFFETTPVIFFWFILNLFRYFPTICFQELQPNDYRCLMKKKVVNTIEDHMNLSLAERKQECIVNELYGLDTEFCCFTNCTVFVKWKCLLCGLEKSVTKNGFLCPNLKDRYFNCNECKKANPCKNNGTVVCPTEFSYEYNMTCECKTGYTGKFCEEKIFVCNYTCEKQQSTTILTYDDTNDASCPHLVGEDCRLLNQYPQSKTNDALHFCDDLPTWMYGSWSQCSKSCGVGKSIRTVICVRNFGNGTIEEFNSSACRYLEQLELVKNCELMKCPVIKAFDINFYQIKTFSPVNILAGMKAYIFQNTSLIVECRTKMRYKKRVQWLMDGKLLTNGRYSNVRISKKKKLKILQDFTNDKITVFTCHVGNFSVDSKVFRIKYLNRNVSYPIKTNTTVKDPSDRKHKHLNVSLTPWSSCSQLCGLGIQTRDFKCEIITDNYIQEFPKSNCPYQELNITLNKTCYIQPCVKWTYTLWTPCSKTCGGGVMKRSAICVRLQANGTFVPTADWECDNLTRDSIFKQCNLYNCSVREIVKKDIEFFQLDTVPKVYLYVGMNASVLTNSNLVIICRTRGIKMDKIRWFKNGIRVRSVRNTRISKKCKLRIKSVSLANEGKYCCRYKSHEECLDLKVYTRSKVDEVHRIRQLYQYHDTSDQFIKDPFDREKRRLNIRLSNWTCVLGEEVRKYLSCEIITNFYIEAFDTKFCHKNYFEEEIELRRRC